MINIKTLQKETLDKFLFCNNINDKYFKFQFLNLDETRFALFDKLWNTYQNHIIKFINAIEMNNEYVLNNYKESKEFTFIHYMCHEIKPEQYGTALKEQIVNNKCSFVDKVLYSQYLSLQQDSFKSLNYYDFYYFFPSTILNIDYDSYFSYLDDYIDKNIISLCYKNSKLSNLDDMTHYIKTQLITELEQQIILFFVLISSQIYFDSNIHLFSMENVLA